ncbi:hypothetical protein [Ruegeria sp. ANG-S4]|uniref:hypothetical protein n=1 Tax=Ruegeria sp. ANG-S4 TaxID=1577904 RepID=UPI00187BE172|nr:hypothetical protein [Ruegeria sp. ANG-S4]
MGANQLDHLYGHIDAVADELEFCLVLGAAPHWRDRFYTGPFILLCHHCHSRKTMHEQRGTLVDWVQANWDVLKQLRPTA